jgi:signal transduction histidine kinase
MRIGWLPRPTVRLRLTLLYGSVFLCSGAGLLAITYFLMRYATAPQPGGRGFLPSVGPGSADPLMTWQHAEQMRELLVQSAIALGVMSLASIALGWFVAGRALRPLRTITAATRDISASNLHHRLALHGPDDELKELGDTVDELLARLEASFQSQRRFVANASHELRTPLTRQRALVQVALSDPDPTVESLRTAHERVLNATRQQEQLIDALLTLARGERGIEARQAVDLADVTNHVLLTRDTETTERGLLLTARLDHAPALGDPRLVERLVANLVDNALRYNVVSGRLSVSTGTDAGRAVLVVSNDGPVVAASEVDRLFQPFQRNGADRTRNDGGLGLGLSIVAAIATAHGATIATHPHPAGGLEITVAFPGVPVGREHPPLPAEARPSLR